MTNMVVIGIPGESGRWLADLTAGTVTQLTQSLSDELAAVETLQSSGGAVIKGVDFAVLVSPAAEVFAGHYDS